MVDASINVEEGSRERDEDVPTPAPQLSFTRRCAPLIISSAVLGLLTVAVFFPHIFLGWTFPWDFLGKYTASPAWVASTVGRGQWTEWVPSEGGGTSIAIDLQAGLYYPLWWLLGALHVALTLHVLTLIQVAHIWAGAVGILVLARARGLEWRWAVVAAIPFVFFGGFYGNGEHADYVRGFAYLPWLLYLLTLPRSGAVWARMVLLPFLVWLLAAGAYPGLTVSFSLVGTAYLLAELAARRVTVDRWLHLLPLALGVLAAALVVVSVFLPYVHAQASGLLYRPNPPTLEARASESFHAVDVLGLYLNDFAWNAEGTGPAWAVGIPVLVGLAGIRRRDVRAQLPLIVASGVALVLGTAAQWAPVGALMLRLPVFFPTRFPNNDYKAMVGVGLVILSSIGWRAMLRSAGKRRWPAPAVFSFALAIGVVLAPHSTPYAATLVPVVAILLALGVFVLALRADRMREVPFIGILVLALLMDGGRIVADWPQYPGGTRPWATPPSTLAAPGAAARDAGARRLAALLAHPPARRPARPSRPVISNGLNGDTGGYLGLAYELGDYGGTVYNARWTAQTDPVLHNLMLLPWNAWTFSCDTVRCDGTPVSLPSPLTWTPDPRVATTEFATSSITYRVSLDHAVVMVENELDIPGWSSNVRDVKRVSVGGVLRGWLLPAGHYSFVASFRQPERSGQEAAAGGALLFCATTGVVVIVVRRRRRRCSRRPSHPAAPVENG